MEYHALPSQEDIEFLSGKLIKESEELGISDPFSTFAFFIRGQENKIIAGCNGYIIFGSIYTDQLWVDERYRKKGLGYQLMQAVHELGLKKGCCMATVATMSFQKAKKFYERLGYICDFQRDGYAQESSCFFLKKNL